MLTSLLAALSGVSIYFLLRYIYEIRMLNALRDRIENNDNPGTLLSFIGRSIKRPVEWLTRINKIYINNRYTVWLEKMFALAGTGQSDTPAEFLAKKELSSAILLAVLLPVFSWHPGFPLAITGAAFCLPDLQLKENRKRFEHAFLKQLPYTLDLISACVEAGLTFDAAILKYIEKSGNDPVAAELRSYIQETRLGVTRKEAIKKIAKRVASDEFNSIASAISRSIEYGVGLSSLLRVQTAQIRFMRTQRIEKLAAEAPVKLLFPLIIFIFPVVFLVIFGPIVLRFFR